MIDPVARAEQWRLFYEQEGGLRDIIETIRGDVVIAMLAAQPWEMEKLRNLAVAGKIIGEIDGYVRQIIEHGLTEVSRREFADKIAKLPTAKRRWL